MPDDLIHCPNCQFQLRLPTELYGTAVECPRCHTRFTAPVPMARPDALRPPPGREYDAAGPAEDYVYAEPAAYGSATAVRPPAIILLVLSGLTLVLSVYGIITADKGAAQVREMSVDPNVPPQFRDFLAKMADVMTPTYMVVTNAIQGGIALITVLGSIQMLRRRTHWLAVLAAILALNPLNCPCCMVQLPIGIWALVVLFRPDVRAAFR